MGHLDEVPDHARGSGGAAGHHQAHHHRVGHSPAGLGHCPRPGEEDAQCLLELQTKATAKADFHLVNFVQENFLNYHTYYIKMIGDLVSKTKRVGDGLGIHIVDRDIARMAAHIVDKYLVRTVSNEHDTTTFIPREDVTNFVVKEALPDYVVA